MRIGPVGIWEILIILVVILLIFGPRRLPEMAKGLGQSVREFRKGIRDMKNEFDGEPERSSERPDPPNPARRDGESREPASAARTEPAGAEPAGTRPSGDDTEPNGTEPRRTDAGA